MFTIIKRLLKLIKKSGESPTAKAYARWGFLFFVIWLLFFGGWESIMH